MKKITKLSFMAIIATACIVNASMWMPKDTVMVKVTNDVCKVDDEQQTPQSLSSVEVTFKFEGSNTLDSDKRVHGKATVKDVPFGQTVEISSDMAQRHGKENLAQYFDKDET